MAAWRLGANLPSAGVDRYCRHGEPVPGLSSGSDVITLAVPKTEEERAYVSLQRCKLILEGETWQTNAIKRNDECS